MPALAAMPIQQWTTANGAKVLFVETHAIPVLDISVEFDAGSRRDPADKIGSGQYSPMARWIRVFYLPMEIMSLSRGFLMLSPMREHCHGGKSGMDRAGYTLRVLSGQAESDDVIQMMSRFLSKPSFPEELLERDKARLVASLREELTRPESIAAKTFKRVYILTIRMEEVLPRNR